jgi:ubiquinone/menaquinone biosynthesis C-methylase UbiE
MNYKSFLCIECTNPTLDKNPDNLRCPVCGTVYQLIESVPIIFPSTNISTTLDGKEYHLEDIKNIYDKAYHTDGIMGTDLDSVYDQVTKSKLLEFAQPLGDKHVLDIGTGVGNLWDYIEEGVEGYAIDPSVIGVIKALQRHPSLTVSASICEKLPYSDQFFDVIVAADTIEHTFYPETALKEIYRVLKNEGILSASFPIPNSLRKWGLNQLIRRRFSPRFLFQTGKTVMKRLILFGTPTFQPIDRDYDASQWSDLLARTGFSLEKVIQWPEPPELPIVYLIKAIKL